MELVYTSQTGEHMTLRQRRPFFLQSAEGMDDFRQALSTFRAPNQDGAFFMSSALDMRNITLTGVLMADTIAQVGKLQKRLLRVFTPKARGTLVYRNSRIGCVVEEVAFTVKDIGARHPSFFISLVCPSPFFEALERMRVELASWINKFFFPLEIPASGIELGQREPSQIATLDNIGDVPCGCDISFKALGTLSNPELMNVRTGEAFRLLKTMSAGEELRVSTRFADKHITQIIGGAESDAFQYMDIASTFFQLAPGRNILRYSAANNLDLLEVSIYFTPLFLGA